MTCPQIASFRLRHVSVAFLLFAFLGCCISSVQAQETNDIRLPDIVSSVQAPQRSVRIKSNDSPLERQAKALFRLHGGFTQVEGSPEFTFTFTPIGAQGLRLEISSGGQTLWSNNFEGPQQTQNLYAAADAAVERTLGIPGFFRSSVAFISKRTGHSEVYLSDLLFTATRQLTSDRKDCLLPELSPDGQTLLYTSYHGTGFPDIYRIDLASGRRTIFAGFRGTNTGATYSPDGSSVAMVLSGSGNSELYLSNKDGQALRRLTKTSSLEADPSWSPDGQRLVFTSDALGKPQIYWIARNGDNYRRVPTNISRLCSEPTWNPRDPNLIAFTAAVGGEFEVALYNFSEQKSTIVSRGAGDAVEPVWLRDGRHLIYTERTPTTSRLMILDSLSGKRANLSPSEFNRAGMATISYPN